MEQKVSKLYELYLSRSDLRPSSIRFKRRALGYFVKWFGDIPAGRVDSAIAEDYRTMLLSVPDPRTGRKRKKSAANGYLANFKPFWEWLLRHGRITDNPFYGLRLFRITKGRRETFTANELSRLMKVSDQTWRVRNCCGLLGMRRGEMLNVQVCDIKLSSPHPHILLCPKKASGDTWPWEVKDHAIRYVALPERMYFDDIVIRLHDDIRQRAGKISWPYLNLEERYYKKLIMWQKFGKPANSKTTFEEDTLDPTGNFQRMFRALQKRAGIRHLKRYHELRAAFATAMIDQGGLDKAAEAMGHSNVQTTRMYNRKSEMSLVEDMGRIVEKCYQTIVP